MLTVRAARPEDAPDVAGVHVRSWQVGYRGLVPDAYLDSLRPADRAARYTFGPSGPEHPRTIVAVEDGVITGFATTGPARGDGAAGAGELMALYVDPPRWGSGAGRLLIAEARTALGEAGWAVALLWVLAGNERAKRFYRRDGWLPDGASKTEEVWGVRADEVRLRRLLP